ncbi:YdgA family protein [Coxiella endosymbiont of Ornithodoros maritimus]|uniref:YdgA family protein n=1 Tax=Coxiella endosymbiont of Ornithodoros maritimus TaxID=1656172 RepID=UPI002264AC36|nr:YdgA family protein [Coxiella endosymbiont of Ornithodoros maritimus]
MRKLINSIIGVALIVVIVLLVLPLGMSFWLKNNYSSILTRLSQSHNVSLKLINFDRGWFASKAVIQVIIPNSEDKTTQPIKFTINQHIFNGPFIFSKNNHKVKLHCAKALLYTTSNDPNFTFHSSTLLRFNNSSKNSIYASNVNVANGQEQIVLKDTNLEILYNPLTQRLVSDAVIKSALISEQQNKILIMDNITWYNDLHYATPLWEGKRSLSLNKFTYYLTPEQPIEVKNFILENQQNPVNDTTTFTFSSHADSIKDAPLNLAPLDIKFSLTQINTAALVNLINTALNQNHLKLNPQQLHQFQTPAINLLAQGLEVSLAHLIFGTEEGQVSVQGQLYLLAQNQSPDLSQIIINSKGKLQAKIPMAWLKKELSRIYEDKKVELDDQALTPEQIADQQIQYWINNKKLIQQNQNVELTINYYKGKLLFNNLPSPAPQQ